MSLFLVSFLCSDCLKMVSSNMMDHPTWTHTCPSETHIEVATMPLCQQACSSCIQGMHCHPDMQGQILVRFWNLFSHLGIYSARNDPAVLHHWQMVETPLTWYNGASPMSHRSSVLVQVIPARAARAVMLLASSGQPFHVGEVHLSPAQLCEFSSQASIQF